MKILLTGGGTGGHIMPILAVVDKLKELNKVCSKAPQPRLPDGQACGTMEPTSGNIDFLFIGPESGFNKIIGDEGIKIKTINAGKLRRYISIKNIFDIIKIPIGVIQSLYIIYKYKPDMVFSKGGYASVPPVVAAWIYRMPIITHESDIVPGLANKIISKFASKILVSFPDSKKYFKSDKIVYTGNPIREDVLRGDKNRAKEIFDLKENIPTVLIFGGSQGAKKINKIILESLSEILKHYQIIHVCGKDNYSELKDKIEKLNIENKHRYKVYPFLRDELKDAYALCDAIVSRAGANSLSEIIALEKPSIIIPLPTSANDHQLQNAEYYSQRKMAILIKEKDLSEEVLKNELLKLLQEIDFRDNIKRKMAEYNKNKKNSASLIAEEIINCK